MRDINWAVLGPGLIAGEFAEALISRGKRVYAVSGRRAEKIVEYAEKYNVIKPYIVPEEMLQDSEIDVVYISTPHTNHYDYIMKCLEANKHVLCEKAITVSSRQLSEINAVAKEKNLIVAEAMTIYHMPLFKKLKAIVDSGALGKIKMIQVTFGSCKEDDPTSRFFNMDLAGGALLDIGTYALSFTRFFMSEKPEEILTTVKKYETGVDEMSGIVLKNSADEMAVITLTMRAKMPKCGVVAGDLGFITVEDFPRAQKAVVSYLDGRRSEIEAGDSRAALKYEQMHMESCLNGTENESTMELSKDVMSIMDEVKKQWNMYYPFE